MSECVHDFDLSNVVFPKKVKYLGIKDSYVKGICTLCNSVVQIDYQLYKEIIKERGDASVDITKDG